MGAADLTPEDALRAAARELYELSPRLWDTAGLANRQAGASMYGLGANIASLVNRGVIAVEEALGMPEEQRGQTLGATADYLRRAAAQRLDVSPEMLPRNLAEKIALGLYTAPATIAEYGAGTALAGGNPMLGMALTDALRAAGPDATKEEVGKAALKGALFGAGLKFTGAVTMPVRTGAMAALGGGAAAAEGAGAEDIAAGAAVMAGLGAAMPGGGMRLRDLYARERPVPTVRTEPTLDLPQVSPRVTMPVEFDPRTTGVRMPPERPTARPAPEAAPESVKAPVRPPTPEPPPVAAPKAVKAAETGKPFTAELHRGSGRKAKGAAYAGVDVPILGEGKYWSIDRKRAERFGPEIETATVTLRNPLVIDSDVQWRALTKKQAGWEFPNPSGRPEAQIKTEVAALEKHIRGLGHDGVVIRLTSRAVSDKTKTMRDVFAEDQVVVFSEAKATRTVADVNKAIAETKKPPLGTIRYTAPKARGAKQPEIVQPYAGMDDLGTTYYNVTWRKVGDEPGTTNTHPVSSTSPELALEEFQNAVKMELVAEVEKVEPFGYKVEGVMIRPEGGGRWKAEGVGEPYGTPLAAAEALIESKKAPEKSVAEKYTARKASEDAEVDAAYVQPEFVPKATVANMRAPGGRWKVGEGYITNGHWLVREEVGPKLRAELSKREHWEPEKLDPKDISAVLESAVGKQRFVPDVVYDRKLDLHATTGVSQIGGRVGDGWVVFDARYYDYLTRVLKLEVLVNPKDVEAPAGLYKGGKKVGALMPIGQMASRLPHFERAVARFAEAKARAPAALPKKGAKKYKPGVMTPEAAFAKADRAIRAERWRAAGYTGKGKLEAQALRDAAVKRLEELEVQAEGIKKKHTEAVTKATELRSATEKIALEQGQKKYTSTFAWDYRQAFMRAWEEAKKVRKTGVTDAARDGFKAGLEYRKKTPPLAVPELSYLDFEIKTLRGRTTKFKLPTDPEFIADFAKRLRGDVGAAKFAMRTPRTVEEVNATLAAEAGDKYIGMRREQKETPTGVMPEGEPITREAVLKPFMEAIGLPLYQGRVRGERLGFYRPGMEEVRIKTRGDLEVTAHEVAHAIDDRIPEIRKTLWYPASKANKKYRDELKAVSYDIKKVYEGWAEFMRLYMTQREKARDVAPNVYGWVEDYFAGHEYGPAIKRAQDQMHAWFEQDALQRARSKIGTPEDIDAHLVGKRSDTLKQAALDDLHGILRMEKDLFGILQEGGMYETARLTRGTEGLLEGTVRFGAPKFMEGNRITFVDAKGRPHANFSTKRGKTRMVENPEFETWGLGEILRPVMADLEAFGLYAVGRRATVLRQEGRERLFKPGEIKAMVALETPARKKAFEDWQVFNKQVLDFAEKAGVIDPVGRQKWQTDVYLPFYRVTEQPGTRRAGGTPGAMKVIYRLKGGDANLGDPIINMMHNTRMLVEAAMFNRARRKVVDAAMTTRGRMGKGDIRGGAKFLTSIPKESKKVAAYVFDVKTAMRDNFERNVVREEKAAEAKGDLSPAEIAERSDRKMDWFEEQTDIIFDELSGLMQILVRNQAPKGGNVIAVMRDGKPSYYEVADPLLLKAMESLPRKHGTGDPMSDVILNAADMVRRVGQATITYSVNFMVRNAIRDPIMAWVLSNNGTLPIIQAAKGLKSRATADPYYREWMANGGALASFFRNEASFSDKLSTFYQRAGIDYGTVLNTPRKVLRFAEEVANSLEVMSRIGEFRKAVERGKTPGLATFEAREITTDFAMRGTNPAVNAAYRSWMFLKAGTEGMYRTYRGFTGENRAQVAGRTAMIAGLSMALYAWNRDNPDYNALPDWDRDTHWHFYIPKADALERFLRTGELISDDPRELYHHWRMPKPWEVGMMGTIAERALEGVLDGMPVEAAKHIARNVWQMFRFPIAPQILEPPLEVAMNYDIFREAPIVSKALERLPPWQQAGPGTARTLRAAGEATRNLPRALQINPAKTEHLLRGWLNAWAMYGLQVSDALFFDDKMALRTEDIPGVGAIYRPGVIYRTRQENEIYDMLRELNETRASLAFSAKSNRIDLAEEALNSEAMKNAPLIGVGEALSALRELQRVSSIAQTLDGLHQFITKLARHPVLGADFRKLRRGGNWRDLGELKREVRDVLAVHKNRIAKKGLEDVKAQQGALVQ